MNAISAKMPNCAKIDGAGFCSNRRRALQLNSRVMHRSRTVWPVKTAHYLSDITGYSLRSCSYWLSGEVVIPSDALAALMHCEQGREFLSAVMADSTPRWWLRLKAWLFAVDLAVEQAKHRRKLRKLLDDAAPELTPALLLQDEDFYQGQPSPHRAVASKKRDRRG